MNRRPALLSGEIYAVAAGAGTLLYVGLLHVDLSPLLATWVAMAVVLVLRVVAIRRSWSLPTVETSSSREQPE